VDGILPVQSWQISLVATVVLWAIAILLLGAYRRKIVFLL
jgi:hypothetical protein